MDEKQLVQSAKGGDRDAFCSLYSLYKDRLYRYALYRLGNEADAEDAVSDCVLSAFKQIDKLKKPEAFSSWIFTILRFSCISAIERRSKNHSTVELDAAENLISTADEKMTEKTELQQALDILKDDEKEIVLLSVIFGFSSKEIAKTSGLTSGAVRSKLSRSLTKMREFLGD